MRSSAGSDDATGVTPPVAVVTIAARNYLPRAEALASSIREHHPDYRMVIVLVDAQPGEVASNAIREIRTPDDLPLNGDEFRRMALMYDVTELSTAIKPWALTMLLDDGADVAIYLDPDIVLYSAIEEVAQCARTHGIVLTPHATSPIPRDGLLPDEVDIMKSGAYNLGFIAVSTSAREMLTWWQQRLSRDCVSAPHLNLFVDQRWIDLVPGYFDHHVLRDPGYNVAYWNLDTRRLSRRDGIVYVNGARLRFFHFSGYDPSKPWALSRYPGGTPRALLSEHPIARELCEQYAAQIATDTPQPRYRFDRFSDGTAVVPVFRTLYRTALKSSEAKGEALPPVPFTGDDRELLAWLKGAYTPGGGVNRVVHALWELRTDLRAAFPDPTGAHQEALAMWAETSLEAREIVPASMLQRVPAATVAVGTAAASEPGVNLAGYFTAELGMGQLGRHIADAARLCGLPVVTLTNTRTASRQQAAFTQELGDARHPVTIAAINADQFRSWYQDARAGGLADSHTIGVWAWEVERFPDRFAEALDLVDEVWALSEYSRRAIAATTEKPVFTVPLPIPAPTAPSSFDRSRLGLTENPYFLFAFDYLSVFQRKNPLAVVDAYCRAFPDEGPHQLVIKSVNGHGFRLQREQLRLRCVDRRDIVLLEEYLDADDLNALMWGATAYVSLHRAEGYGLTMAEAMARGRPVVATAYSGNLDFMDETTSLLVPYRLVPVGGGSEPYPDDCQWAEPDIDAAATFLRWIAEHPDDARKLGLRGRSAVLHTHTLERTSAFIRSRVEAALAPRRDGSSGAVPRAAVAARGAVARKPTLDSPTRMHRLAPAYRKLVYRAMQHHDEHVGAQLAAVVEAVCEIDADLRAAQDRQQRADAAIDDIQRSQNVAGRAAVARNELEDVALRDLHGGIARISELTERLSAVVANIDARLTNVASELARVVTELVASPYTAVPGALRLQDAAGHITMGYRTDPNAAPGGYAGFEDIFRGSEPFIEDRLRPYIALLRDSSPVLDIGCGRGELLALLASAGIDAVGIDLDAGMIDRARDRGLSAQLGDGLDLLASSPAKSYGAVAAIQVVEHLPVSAMQRFFELAHEALRPGGTLIVETVNPHSPPALKAFWLDLTHVRPLYPEALLLLARDCGFASAQVMFPVGGSDLAENLRMCGEYAVVATKS